ncbi:hypothetical protein SCOR_04880 [Sulfidibacter corallicola]|uniref:Dihydrofolate synthase/folylpolyglutamate synthase n=1 Tax=Sulfidibacter corallicola TaxID=2818388 RepID=A0A8A4TS53_SULCO|nr:hypothetical protein [Sulfidibacter corallicola]QTD51892.1 hypothetical protein J3U87_05420 [Sulfidibacter corallicola]
MSSRRDDASPTFPFDPERFDPAYLVTLDELYHSGWAARKKRRIAFMREAVAHFWPKGHPTRLIHITGTNGKGSVAHYLCGGLRFAGGTGSWTGPHVFDYAERFHLDGEKVGHDEIVTVYRKIIEPYQQAFMARHPGESLTFAEQGILLALHLFQRHAVVWGVMEVGAGGRYTPLMALDVHACVLTNVAEDHPKTLGEHGWQRALEKAGIARHGRPFFTAAEGVNRPFVEKTAQAEGAEVIGVADGDPDAIQAVLPRREPGFKLRNLALACKVIRHFYPGLSLEVLTENMVHHLPARFWRLAPNVVADVAHNADKIAKLAEQLRLAYPSESLRLIVGLTRNRDARAVFRPLLRIADHVVVTSASYVGQSPRDIAEALRPEHDRIEVVDDPAEAYRRERTRLADGEVLVLTGSAYMIDQALNENPFLRHVNASFGWRNAPSDMN